MDSRPSSTNDRAASTNRTGLICFAVKEEARYFKATARHHVNIRVLITGMGQRNAAVIVSQALRERPPSFALTCGFAGGLNPSLARRALVFAADQEFDQAAFGVAGAKPARFHCAERVAVTVAEKKRLRAATGADAVDMESAIIRQLCRERGVPSATLRVISDTAHEDLALDFNAALTPAMKLNYAKLAWMILRSPARIPALLTLGKQSNEAARRLADCLDSLLKQRIC